MTEGVADSEPTRASGTASHLAASAQGAIESGRRMAAGAAQLVKGQSIAISSLTTRIFMLTLVALGVQIGGLLAVSQHREGLIELKLASLKTHAEMIAVTIAESAGDPINQNYDRVNANEVLRRLVVNYNFRAQIFDSRGRLTGDTRALLTRTIVIEDDAPPTTPGRRGALALIESLGDYMISAFNHPLPLYQETPPAGLTRVDEVYAALGGAPATFERVNSEGELILSVAVPIRQVRVVMGALVLSTEGGDIGALTAKSYDAILKGFGVAALVTLMLSIVLAHTIARPIRQLSEAAEDGRRREKAPLDLARVDIPDLSQRGDEIGQLSIALRRMTGALYQRIDAIESFAADVAHEIKNPLTSMRSAVESFRAARNDEQRAQLLAVIEQDVRRMDRLVTDIANASRLDAELVREQRERFDLLELMTAVISITESVCENRRVRLKLDAAVKTAPIRGLEERLAQVFLNLLDNAASFSPEDGLITVTLAHCRLNGAEAWRVDVIDEGPGVPHENLESVFERFYSERPEEHGFGEHSGLGLNICRQIVEAHGGRIWCENRTDRSGAVFSVSLPL